MLNDTVYTFPMPDEALVKFTGERNSMGHRILRDDFMLADAIALNSFAFRFKFDKGGEPYIEHLLAVMYKLRTNDKVLKVIAVSHDFIEDIFEGNVEEGRKFLLMRGWSDRAVDGIASVTKEPGELYEVYQLKVLGNVDGLRVKYRDIDHNSDLRRIKGVRQKDFDRHVKYMAFSHRIAEYARLNGITL
jgi:GTP diphosphokinase / guanosine-3',5'-bis(diphosphate) 3'-diphosphatase